MSSTDYPKRDWKWKSGIMKDKSNNFQVKLRFLDMYYEISSDVEKLL